MLFCSDKLNYSAAGIGMGLGVTDLWSLPLVFIIAQGQKVLRHDVHRQLFNGTYCIHDVIRMTSHVISGSISSPQGYTNGQWRSFFKHMDICRKNLAQNFCLVTITLIINDNLELKHCILFFNFTFIDFLLPLYLIYWQLLIC